MDRAIVLLSGGLDSAVCLLWAMKKKWEIHALTFRYSQSQSREIKSAKAIAKRFGVREHRIVKVPF
ncbi:MAG: 7-cyano-7-deazaguanine synthase, partial [Nitrososphaerales archaeon]